MAKKALADQTWHSFVAIFHIFLYTDLEFVIRFSYSSNWAMGNCLSSFWQTKAMTSD